MVASFAGEACIERHRVMIHDRGGVRRIGALEGVAEVEWNRERDAMSTAKVILSARSCVAQEPFLNEIAARRHEMVIFRGKDRVWEGPLLETNWYSNRVEILANDVFDYTRSTIASVPWLHPEAEDAPPVYMTERIREILEYELLTPYIVDVGIGGVPDLVTIERWEQLDPPANVLPHLEVRPSIGPGGLLTRASVEAFQMFVGEHLLSLAEGGLDFTVVGRKLLIWDSAQSIGRTRILTDADFYGELRVIDAGGEHASIGHVAAQPAESVEEEGEVVDAGPSLGSAGGVHPFYGAWTTLSSTSSEEGSAEPTQMALNSQARRLIAGRTPVPQEIVIPQGGGLRLSHDLTINQLVPGTVMPVRATLNLRPVQQDQRLDKLTVRETAAGETVQASLSPSGVLAGV